MLSALLSIFLMLLLSSKLLAAKPDGGEQTSAEAGLEGQMLSFAKLYLAINTTNPPGNENKAAVFLKSMLSRNGIAAKIEVSPYGGYNLVSTIYGDGSLRPLVLANHMDVNAPDLSRWSVPPFGGVADSECFIGKGAKGSKGLALMQLFAFIKANNTKKKPKRDLIFLALSDGVSPDQNNVSWMAKKLIEEKRIEYLLGPGGAGKNGILGIKGTAFLIFNGTRRSVSLRLKLPIKEEMPKEVPSRRIISVLEAINAEFEEMKIDKEASLFIKSISQGENLIKRLVLRNLDLYPVWFSIKEKILGEPILAEILYDRIELNKLVYENGLLSSDMVIRLRPSTDLERILAGWKGREALRGAEFKVLDEFISSKSPSDGPLFEAIESSIKSHGSAHDTAVPYIASHRSLIDLFRENGVTSYGFIPSTTPSKYMASDEEITDEKICKDDLIRGAEILYDIILKTAF